MALIIGIDIGGTHADGVLLEKNEVLVKKKVQVNQENLSESVITLLKALLPDSPEHLSRIHLSTTLCTNAIINDTLDTVGMFIQAGPGMNPDFLACGDFSCFLDGAIDHRGHSIKKPSHDLIQEAARTWQAEGISSIGVVTKFSHRNNTHEQDIKNVLADQFAHISMGHRISGLPNFPRRVYSTWLNAALINHFLTFKKAMEHGLEQLGVTCPCHILKADGGTIPFFAASDFPCESIHSGPSASVMGCLALQDNLSDTVLLDIGGTTTDIAILAQGVPLLEPYGITIQGRPTLIRALNTRSVGLGGDSGVSYADGSYTIGPHKLGAPMAFGGQSPTPTDAMVVLETIQEGDQEKAIEAMRSLRPEQKPEQTATQLLHTFAMNIKNAVDVMLDEVFSRPVYTVKAFLDRKKIVPRDIVTVGGPASAMQSVLKEVFGLPCIIPDNYEVANAIGAARTRPTLQATLYADTTERRLAIPETGCREKIGSHFTMQDAEARLAEAIEEMARDFGVKNLPDIDFIERQEMNTVRGFRSSGKIISLKAQIQPGLETL